MKESEQRLEGFFLGCSMTTMRTCFFPVAPQIEHQRPMRILTIFDFGTSGRNDGDDAGATHESVVPRSTAWVDIAVATPAMSQPQY